MTYKILFEKAEEILTIPWNMFLKYGKNLGDPQNMEVILLSCIGNNKIYSFLLYFCLFIYNYVIRVENTFFY